MVKKKKEHFRHFNQRNRDQALINSLRINTSIGRNNSTGTTKGDVGIMKNDDLNVTNTMTENVINTMTEIQRTDGAFNITAIGCGNGGGRIVDELAKKRNPKGEPLYTCLAINSNDGDLKALKNIPKDKQVDLELGGMGKDPKNGLKILNNDKKIIKKIKDFVLNNMSPVSENDDKKDLILLFAVLGGGTGTSTILKLAQEFLEQNKNGELKLKILDEVLDSYGLNRITVRDYPQEVQDKIMAEVEDKYEKSLVKIGIVAVLPDKHLSAKELETVQEFTAELWELARPRYDEDGEVLDNQVAFIHIPDNQHLSDLFDSSLMEEQRKPFGSYRNFANYMIANTIHELNTIPKLSEEDTNLDTADLHKLLLEYSGYLSLNRNETVKSAVKSSDDIVDMFMQGFSQGHLHSDLEIKSKENGAQAHIFHTGITVVIDDEVSEQKMNQLGNGKFIDDARKLSREEYVVDGQFYEGTVTTPNNGNITVYTIFKTDALPYRVHKGLSEEILAAKSKKVNYAETSTIQVSKKASKSNSTSLADLLASAESQPSQDTPGTNPPNDKLAALLKDSQVEVPQAADDILAKLAAARQKRN